MMNVIKSSLRTFLLLLTLLLSPLIYAANTVVDVLVVYTQGVADLYGGDPSTRFNQVFQFTNQIYSDSQLNVELRLVKTQLVNYTDDNSADTALRAITNGEGVFSGINSLREQYGADIVIFYRPFRYIHGNCGLAWIGGSGTNGDFSRTAIKGYMYSHVAIDSCGDFVTAHELGHNMGLKHSREQDGSGGTLPYALGYGVTNKFTTVMAYQSTFNVDYWNGKIYKFSSPDLTCDDLPCGIARTDTKRGADARHALSITAPQIANYYESVHVNSVAVSDVELLAIQAQVNEAKQKHQAAQKALADNNLSIYEKTQQQAALQITVTNAVAAVEGAHQVYAANIIQYNDAITLLKQLHTEAFSASTTVLNESTTVLSESEKTLSESAEASSKTTGVVSNSAAKRKRVVGGTGRDDPKNTAAQQAYKQQLQIYTDEYIALAKARQAVTAAAGDLLAATAHYQQLHSALIAEQARTADLVAQVNLTSTTYYELLNAQNALLKQTLSF